MHTILMFIVIQFVTVIISTIKSITTVRSTPAVAGIVNAVSYTFNAGIVKLITEQNIYIVLLITLISNLIGVPIGKIIVDKIEKSKLWIYIATIESDEEYTKAIKDLLLVKNISCIYQEIIPNKLYELKAYSKTKNDSVYIKQVLNNFDNIKYHIIEPL